MRCDTNRQKYFSLSAAKLIATDIKYTPNDTYFEPSQIYYSIT
jgi:hypothetical protein